MKIIKNIKVNNKDGSSEVLPVGADAVNIDLKNGKTVEGAIEDIDSEIIKTKPYIFDTVADMKKASFLKNEDNVMTSGYYKINDEGSAIYKITNVKSETEYQEDLENGLFATLIIKDNTINMKQLGIKDNEDCTNILNNAIKYFDIIILTKCVINYNNLSKKFENKILKNGEITLNYSNPNILPLNLNNVYFNNIKIIANNYATNIIKFSNSNNIKLINCYIDGNGYSNGIFDREKPKNGISFENCENIQILSLTLKNIQYRFGVIFTKCLNSTIKNSYFENIGGSAVELSNSNKNISIINNKCVNCCINNLGQEFDLASDGVIDTYGKLDELTDYNNFILINDNIIEKFGNSEMNFSGIRISGSNNVTIINNSIYNKLVEKGQYLIVQDRNKNPSSNNQIIGNKFICDNDLYFPPVIIFQNTGINNLFNSNIINTKKTYTSNKYVIYIKNLSKDWELSNNIINNSLINGVPIGCDGKNIKIFNNILNTNYRSIVCSNAENIIISNNDCNAGHNYSIQLTGTCNNIKSLYNHLSPNNGIIKIDPLATNCENIGSYNWK